MTGLLYKRRIYRSHLYIYKLQIVLGKVRRLLSVNHKIVPRIRADMSLLINFKFLNFYLVFCDKNHYICRKEKTEIKMR